MRMIWWVTGAAVAAVAGYQGTPLFLLNGAPIRWGTPIDQVIAQVKQALGH
jgi:protein-disulfide isomerase